MPMRIESWIVRSALNQANRYEAKCPHGAVLVIASTRAVLGDLAVVRPFEGLQLKGVSEPVTGYIVESIADPVELS